MSSWFSKSSMDAKINKEELTKVRELLYLRQEALDRLKEQKETDENTIAEKIAEITELTTKIAFLEEQLSKKKAILAAKDEVLNEKFDDIVSLNVALGEKMTALRIADATLKQHVLDSRSKEEALKSEVDRVHNLLEEKEAEVRRGLDAQKELQLQLDETNANLSQSYSAKELLGKELEIQHAVNSTLEKTKAALTQLLKERTDALVQSVDKYHTSQNELDQLRKDHDEVSDALTAPRKLVAELEVESDNHRQMLQALQKEHQAFVKKSEIDVAQIAHLKHELADKEKVLGQKQKIIEDSHALNKVINDDLAQAREANQFNKDRATAFKYNVVDLAKKVKDKDAKIESLTTEVHDAATSITEKDARIASLEQWGQNLKCEIGDQSRALERVYADLDTLKTAKNDRASDLEHASELVAELQKQCQDLEDSCMRQKCITEDRDEELQSKYDTVQGLTAQIEELYGQISSTKDLLEEKVEEIASLEKKLAGQQQLIDNHGLNMEGWKAQVEEALEEVDAKQSEIDELNHKISDRYADFDEANRVRCDAQKTARDLGQEADQKAVIIAEQEAELLTLKEQAEQLISAEATISRHPEEIAKLETQASADAVEAERKLTYAKESLAYMHTRFNDLNTHAQDLQRQGKHDADELTSAKAELSDLHARLAQLEKKAAQDAQEAERKIAEGNKALTARSAVHDELIAKIKRQSEASKKLEGDVAKKNQSIEDLEDKLIRATHESKKWRKAHSEAEQEHKNSSSRNFKRVYKLNSEIETQAETIESQRKALIKQGVEIGALRVKVAQLEEQVAAAKVADAKVDNKKVEESTLEPLIDTTEAPNATEGKKNVATASYSQQGDLAQLQVEHEKAGAVCEGSESDEEEEEYEKKPAVCEASESEEEEEEEDCAPPRVAPKQPAVWEAVYEDSEDEDEEYEEEGYEDY